MVFNDEQIARAQVALVVTVALLDGIEYLSHEEIVERCQQLTLADTVIACQQAVWAGVLDGTH